MTDDSSVPRPPFPEIDVTVPHSARVWNYWLGGKDNYAVDRAAGDQYQELFPQIVDAPTASTSATPTGRPPGATARVAPSRTTSAARSRSQGSSTGWIWWSPAWWRCPDGGPSRALSTAPMWKRRSAALGESREPPVQGAHLTVQSGARVRCSDV
jgi:hypothetical protein